MLARILEEHVARTFGEVDKVIQGAAEQYAARGGLQRLDERTVHEQLKRRQARLPQVASMGAVLPSGKMLARASEYPIRPADVSDREDVQFFRDNPSDTAYIGAPMQNPFGPGRLIHLTRRITLSDGASGGILRGAIATEYLVRFYADLNLPPDTVIALVKPDGNPIFRHPHVDNLAQFNVSKTAAFKDGRPAGRMGLFTRTSPADGRDHLVAYRWLSDESLGIFVGTPTAPALAESRRSTLRLAAGALLVAVVIGALFRLIFRNLRREEATLERQRQTDQRLRESEAILRAIFENAQEGILVSDGATARFTMTNPAMCRMLGYREDELLVLSPQDLHPPEALARLQDIFRTMGEGKFSQVHDLPFRRKDGSIIYMDASPTPFNVEGRPAFLGVFRDVTERRQAREALAASTMRLREAQRLARLGNWELDLTTNTLHWSDEIFRIFEIDPAQFDASYEAFLATVHPDDRDKVNAAYLESVERRTNYEVTHRLLFADGRIKHVRERGETHYAENGTPLRSIGTVQDITEQVLAEQEIRALNETLERRVAERTEELAQANRELESFSYSVSHDLRAPLRAINGFSRILQEAEEFAVSAENRDLLDRIVRNTNRMGDLIDDILDYSRASQTALNRKEVDLTTLARATWEEHAPSYPHASAQIGQLCTVWGDSAMLRQVFDNLVANALKYSGKREQAEIEIGMREENGVTSFYVRDNGAGFDMQFAGKLFGMFQRMHTDKDFPGTGVGLAIVKRIVERHGGRVWAEAAPDAGATFWFTLPRYA